MTVCVVVVLTVCIPQLRPTFAIMPKRPRDSFKFPFDGTGYHVTVRPTEGVSEDFGLVLLDLCEKKFKYVLANFEEEGVKRHLHALVHYDSGAANLRRLFTRCLDEQEVEYGVKGVHVEKVSSTIYNVVQYIQKDSDGKYVLMKGFEKTWIDDALKLAISNKKIKRITKTVASGYEWETVARYAEENQMHLKELSHLKEVLVCMAKDGYIWSNFKRQMCILKQALCTVGDCNLYRDMLDSEFRVF